MLPERIYGLKFPMVRNLVPKDLHNQDLFPDLKLERHTESLWLCAYRNAGVDLPAIWTSISDKRSLSSFPVRLHLIPKQLIDIGNKTNIYTYICVCLVLIH